MNPTLRNILAVVIGIISGAMLNGGIISISGSVIPPPDGVDVSNVDSIAASMHLFEPRHFIMPFLAHALGTLFGAYVVTLIAVSQRLRLALVVGAAFFAGGLMMVVQLPAPMWFNTLDLVGAYFPMAWLGWKISRK
jgi:hypothetical protein